MRLGDAVGSGSGKSRALGGLLLALGILASGLLACDTSTGPEGGLPRPRQTDDGWATASPETVGMDSGPLLDLLERVAGTEAHLLHSLLIVKDGKLVFEVYWPGIDLEPHSLAPVPRAFDRETLHYVASVSKSITSALAGIALDRGLIFGVEAGVLSFFPDYAEHLDPAKERINLGHLLSFTSGLDWNEFVFGFDDPRDSHYQMFRTSDPLGFLLGRPALSEPGSAFHYNSGDTNLLGEVVRRASGSATLVAFAEETLFRPLGIESFEWLRFPLADEVTFASGGASLRPRDMAKLGALYLNGGRWKGVRVVSSSWVEASTRMSIQLPPQYRSVYGYGFNWWLGRSRFRDRTVAYFRASGWGGQDIFVYPELDMVVVFTAGGYYDPRPLGPGEIIEDYILLALMG